MVELLVAIVILAVGLLSLVVVQAYAAKSRTQNFHRALAAQLASTEAARIEEAFRLDPTTDFRQTSVPAANGMTLTVDVQDNWNGSANLKSVTLTVTYPSANNDQGGAVRVWTLLRQAN